MTFRNASIAANTSTALRTIAGVRNRSRRLFLTKLRRTAAFARRRARRRVRAHCVRGAQSRSRESNPHHLPLNQRRREVAQHRPIAPPSGRGRCLKLDTTVTATKAHASGHGRRTMNARAVQRGRPTTLPSRRCDAQERGRPPNHPSPKVTGTAEWCPPLKSAAVQNNTAPSHCSAS